MAKKKQNSRTRQIPAMIIRSTAGPKFSGDSIELFISFLFPADKAAIDRIADGPASPIRFDDVKFEVEGYFKNVSEASFVCEILGIW